MTVPTLTIRVPPVLKNAVDQAAFEANLSTNMWVQRLLERELTRIQSHKDWLKSRPKSGEL